MDNLVVHDFDEIGVPSSADVNWRQRSVEDWVRQALRYQAQGVDVLLTGQSPLGEILASPSAPQLNGIAACLLDVDDRERCQRLERRDPGAWDRKAKQALTGWARWHRDHARDPQSRPEVITDSGWDRMRWDRWATWTSADPRWHVTVIDTSGHSVARSAEALRGWVRAARQDLADRRSSFAEGWASNAARTG